ncbi:uncharacterized protein An01g06380 [Aspergillus niger]|uniref:Contig An01c0240, genomic contig n=2 Tax=Aspergillus niger TaxID=5061 RepID=A2Q924_ASPNC|nr:uncharacterized protein An01g06380 [Aspergillus niger]CAK43758.1 unnamed protein product [Aspergillus niger]
MASSATIRSLQRKHPLQRLSSPSRGFSALVHVSTYPCRSLVPWADVSFPHGSLLVLPASSSRSSSTLSSATARAPRCSARPLTNPFSSMHENPNRANEAYGWHFQYLTVIGLTLATLTFTAGLLADMTLSARLFLAKNLLSVCSAPMEVLISILYWGLRLIDKRLVVPDWVILPMHAVLPALALSSTIAFGYWFWIERCFQFNGWYPYPVFDAVGFEGRVGLFALSAVVMALSTGTLKWLYGRVNGYGTSAKAQSRPGAIKSNGSI